MKMDIAVYTITELDAVFYLGILCGMGLSIFFIIFFRFVEVAQFIIDLWTQEDVRDELRMFIKAVGKYKK